MNRCSACTATLDFYGISVQSRGYDENGVQILNWTRWSNCSNCGLFTSFDEHGIMKGTQKQEPPKTLFIPLKEKHE